MISINKKKIQKIDTSGVDDDSVSVFGSVDAIPTVLFFEEVRKKLEDKLKEVQSYSVGKIIKSERLTLFRNKGKDIEFFSGSIVNNRTPKGQSRVSILIKDPTNVLARLDLIEPYILGDKKMGANLKGAENIYLQALFAASMNESHGKAISYALRAQKGYLRQMEDAFIREYNRIKQKGDSISGTLPEDHRKKSQYYDQAKERKDMVEFLKQCDEQLQVIKIKKDIMINLKKSLLQEDEVVEKEGKDLKEGKDDVQAKLKTLGKDTGLYQGFNDLLVSSVYLVPLQQQNMNLINALKKIYKDKPLGLYHEARFHKVLASFYDSAIHKEECSPTDGISKSDLEKRRSKEMGAAIGMIQNAVNMVPDNPKEVIDQRCIEQFGAMLLETHKMLPGATSKIIKHIPKARSLLAKVSDTKNQDVVRKLQSQLYEIEEEFSIKKEQAQESAPQNEGQERSFQKARAEEDDE
ncbi:hypothetical protein WDW89_24785 [Deltaproteobacteria bacterium TL4]